MAVAQTVQRYLHQVGVQYSLRPHRYSEGSMRTASCSGIPFERLAKGVLVEDESGQAVLALIPADRHLSLFHLSRALGRHFHLVDEAAVMSRFFDCRPGAIPALGAAYQLETVVDDSLRRNPEVFMEGGDHQELIQLTREQFHSLTRNCQCGYFSVSNAANLQQFVE